MKKKESSLLFKSFFFELVFGLVVALICCSVEVSGQIQFPIIEKLEDPLNQLGGSFQVVINPIVEDSLGYLWIGSKNGLCKYSGTSIHCYEHQNGDRNSIDGNDIENLFLDSRHHLWVAIQTKGINLFDIQGNKIKSFKYNPNDQNGIQSNRVWGIFEDEDGYIWISYFSGGLSRYDYKLDRFDHFSIDSDEFLSEHRPKTVVKVEKHDSEPYTLWLSTTRGLVKFNTRTQEYKSFLFYSEPKKKVHASNYNFSRLESNWNRCMVKDDEGILWLGNFGGMVRFDTQNETYTVFFDESQPFIRNVVGLLEYNDEYLLLSQNSGLVLFSKKDFSYFNLSDRDELGENYHLDGRFYQAKNGCLYIVNAGGKNKGIYKTCDQYKSVQDFITGGYIEDILATDNYLFYYTKKAKITAKNIKTAITYSYPLAVDAASTVKSIIPLKGDTVLFSDFHHVYQFYPRIAPQEIVELNIENAYRFESLLLDNDGNIWTGRQRDGVYKYDRKAESIIHYNQSSSPALVYQDLIENMMEDDEGDIWIATEQGWSIFNPRTNTTKNYHSDDIAQRFGIDLKVINDFDQTENGDVWISTRSNGLIQWDKKNEKVIRVLDESSGLRSNYNHEVLIDEDDNIWIAARNVLSYINTKTYEIRNFGKEFGLSKQMNTISLGKDGIIYGGHANGYFEINTKQLLSLIIHKNEPIIEGFSIFGEANDSLLTNHKTIHLKHNQNFISFDFGSINYFNPVQEIFQYQLLHLDQHWIDAKGIKKKGYTGLASGKYTFRVRSKDEGEWGREVSKNIVIYPPWYRTWWFLTGMFILGGLILYGILKFYIQYQKRNLENDKRFAQLETMILKSQMNPHFIFNSLNSIRYLFMKDEKDKGLKYITKFAKLLRSTLNHGDVALVSFEDEIELTELYIALEQLRFDDEFEFINSYPQDENWKYIKIPPFVIQPIVENAFWHGLSTSKKEIKKLSISIKKEGNNYSIHIEDNGVGVKEVNTSNEFDISVNKKKSFGLKLIKERFELINKTQSTQYSLDVINKLGEDSGVEVVINVTP